MKKKLISGIAGLILALLFIVPSIAKGQSEKAVAKKYLSQLPSGPKSNTLQKYRMTAVYTNRDLYGKFTDKTKVVGDYTRGLPGDSAMWENVYVAVSKDYNGAFPQGNKQDYMEKFKYLPSDKMLEEASFKSFPKNVENVFARNLIWDMYSADVYAWFFYDSLKLNVPYVIQAMQNEFKMADIGNYAHNKTILCWKGITEYNGQMCAIIDFAAIDNKIELTMDIVNTKGTEQYWGTILVSLKNKDIERCEMYSGTIQEIEVKGMKDKFLMKTIRELEINKIQ
jgi:hypothetical protein